MFILNILIYKLLLCLVIIFRGCKGSNVFGQVSSKKCRIERIKDVKRGMHIAYDRGLYWHHAIVIEVDCIKPKDEIELIEFGCDGVKLWETKIRRRFQSFSPGILYQVLHEFYLSAEKIVKNALSLLGQADYCLFRKNCEHVANWCVEENQRSEQIDCLKMNCINLGKDQTGIQKAYHANT